MCSNQGFSDAYHGSQPIESWEEALWGNISPPSSSSSNTSPPVSDAGDHTYSKRTKFIGCQDYQMPTSNCQNVSCQMVSSSILSPASDNAKYRTPQTCTNMSSYFSSFDPTSQDQDIQLQRDLIRNSLDPSIQFDTSSQNIQASINVVPTGNGSFKAIVKKKRKRTNFTTEQVEVLEQAYTRKQYVTRDERQILVHQLQVNDKSVKIWFQNRRLKHKKGDDQESEDGTDIFDRLDAIEDEIKKRTNENGFVTLDDEIMRDLVNVIDDYFSSQ